MSIWRRTLWICFKLVYLSALSTVIYNPCSAQESLLRISGSVVDAESKIPLSRANVYLEQTTIGTVTTDSGTFVLNVPNGTHRLIVSFIGYKSFVYKIERGKISKLLIQLDSETRLLNEVKIKINPRWQADFSLFQIIFLGYNFKHCEILNPKVLYFNYTKDLDELRAKATEPLIIDNRFLGYRLYYDLTSFIYRAGRTSYTGYTRFEELHPKDNKEQKLWKKNRKQSYLGSSNHFMYSLVNNHLKKDDFVIRKLVKTDILPQVFSFLEQWPENESNSSDTIVTIPRTKTDFFPYDSSRTDNKIKLPQLKKKYNVIYPGQIFPKNIITYTTFEDIFRIAFDYSLLVAYKRNEKSMNFSIITMLEKDLLIDTDGNLNDPNALLYEGYWGALRIGDQLPINFLNKNKEKKN